MIKIHFEEPDTADWVAWRKECESATKVLIETVENGGKVEIVDLYKRKNIKYTYYLSKDGPFGGKCAYCETAISLDQYGDMEHYRPKNAVADKNGDEVRVEDKNGQAIPHPGYYWLAYDWQNLLPACVMCNRPNPGNKNIGKHDKFPVKNGIYALSPGEEKNEHPLLINPLLEDPENHFEVNLETGILGGDERAQCCIRVFGLNERPGLREARKDAYTAVLGLAVKYLNSKDKSEEDECLAGLCDFYRGNKPYSLVGKTYLKKKGLFVKYLAEMCFSSDK